MRGDLTLMNISQRLIAASRARSPWFYCVNAGSCNGCDIEIAAALGPRYDAEQMGALRQGSPKHADILVVTGPITRRAHAALCDIFSQMPGPKAVVAVGSCPATGNVFAGSPSIDAPLEDLIPVEVYVPGCPPRPQAILQGLRRAAAVLGGRKAEE